MAVHDYAISNASGAVVREDLNNVLAAIVSQNSSASPPTPLFAHMRWFDTANNQLKQRNTANSGWIILGGVSGNNWIPYHNGAPITSTTTPGGTPGSLVPGTAATNIVQLDANARIPALDGSQLTHLHGYIKRTSNYTVTAGDSRKIIACNSSNNGFTITLPRGNRIYPGFTITVLKVLDENNLVTIRGSTSSEKIEARTTYRMGLINTSVTLVWTESTGGYYWRIIDEHIPPTVKTLSRASNSSVYRWDAGAFPRIRVSLTISSSSMATPTNVVIGRFYFLLVQQDGTPSGTLSWSSSGFDWPGNSAPAISTGTAYQSDIFLFYGAGTTRLWNIGAYQNIST